MFDWVSSSNHWDALPCCVQNCEQWILPKLVKKRLEMATILDITSFDIASE
ncbi:hypothetical protein BFX18_01640 [Vibrio cholerae]|nr:hypothetical protein BFX18_01640 [Vibrio cholerae]OFJ11666.1 hypothetical protein BFX28_01835 [Vibrio cholerae]OFJ16706.1 hypothetical protein BFX29_01810 [Vibrio cholerae]OFJ33085.1 hypothetical protein BFX35_01450 [Vibrio cholerae]